MAIQLIPTAYAEVAGSVAQTPQQAGSGSFILLFGFIIVIFYVMIIRPQNKRAKEHRDLLEGISKGDEVATSGGLLGKVVRIEDNFIVLSISDNVEIKIQKPAVTAVLPKGTLKSI